MGGTLEYVSRDGHLGCVSRRGDMECLLYVIIEWLGGHLPWDTDDDERLKPTKIQEMKIHAFHNIEDFLTNKCQFKDKAYPTRFGENDELCLENEIRRRTRLCPLPL